MHVRHTFYMSCLKFAGENMIMANGQVTSSSSFPKNITRTQNKIIELLAWSDFVEFQKTWCVAKPSSDQATLLGNINFACSQVDCQILRRGCPCYAPDNLINHASIAMNLYYQAKGRNHWNCDFRNSALIVQTDPSKT